MSRIKTDFAGQSVPATIFYRFCRLIVSGFTRVYTRMSIEGREHLPATGGYVLAPVHRSYIDTPICGCVTTRRLRFMGKDSMWKYKPVGWMFTTLGSFPVSRGTADREALKRCVAVLEGGEPLVLYPEGERKDGPIVQPLFDGAAFVAARAGVPIVPVAIGGSADVMPRHAKFIYPKKVKVLIGEPITVPTGDSGRASRRAIGETTESLRTTLQELFDRVEGRA